jgi:hypothetical protein
MNGFPSYVYFSVNGQSLQALYYKYIVVLLPFKFYCHFWKQRLSDRLSPAGQDRVLGQNSHRQHGLNCIS